MTIVVMLLVYLAIWGAAFALFGARRTMIVALAGAVPMTALRVFQGRWFAVAFWVLCIVTYAWILRRAIRAEASRCDTVGNPTQNDGGPAR